MPIVEVRQTVFVTAPTGVDSFDFPIYLSFTPDEVIVRSIVIEAALAGFCIIKTNLVREGTLCIATENATPFTGGTFQLQKPVNGSYSFQVLTAAGALQVLAGPIAIQLEFVKYLVPKRAG